MRQENAVRILKLALAMRGSVLGISLQEICDMFEVSERTAHRLRDAVVELFPGVEVIDGTDQKRRWRLPKGTIDRLTDFTAEEIASLETAQRILEQHGFQAPAAQLASAQEKLKSLINPDLARRLEPDVEALIEAEGVALRPGPRPLADPLVLQALRQAIKGCVALQIRYCYRRDDGMADLELEPYGILLGSRHYLVARRSDESDETSPKLYSLPEIKRAELTERVFTRDPSISLREFAERSFGVFQEKPQRVVWRFSNRAVRDASSHRFHPSQKTRWLADGRLEVEFVAGGLLEMCWHLFTWGRFVEIVEPAALRDLYARCLMAGGWPMETGDLP